jgi:hypothetical protein
MTIPCVGSVTSKYNQRTVVPTYTAQIYVGLRKGYDGHVANMDDVRTVCREFCDEIGLCVTVTETTYIYTNGREPGAIVGLINYPRFPKDNDDITEIALALADDLMLRLQQYRATVVFPDKTIMIGEK